MASVTIPTQFSDYYNQLSNMLNNSTNYQTQSASSLKDSLSKIMQPSYQKEITARQKTAKSNKAAIDADAASRGIGSSTWVTDAKSRQNDAAAQDISSIKSDYNSALYSALMNRLASQDELNLNARLQAQNNAMSGASTLYQQWLNKQAAAAAASSGGGYSYSGSSTKKTTTGDDGGYNPLTAFDYRAAESASRAGDGTSGEWGNGFGTKSNNNSSGIVDTVKNVYNAVKNKLKS